MAAPMTEREIAKALGINQSVVHRRIRAALRKLAHNRRLQETIEEIRDNAHRAAVEKNIADNGIKKDYPV
jgi:predicted transcriptional regulator